MTSIRKLSMFLAVGGVETNDLFKLEFYEALFHVEAFGSDLFDRIKKYYRNRVVTYLSKSI